MDREEGSTVVHFVLSAERVIPVSHRLLDEMAALLWQHLGNRSDYATLDPAAQEVVQDTVRALLMPLLERWPHLNLSDDEEPPVA